MKILVHFGFVYSAKKVGSQMDKNFFIRHYQSKLECLSLAKTFQA